MRTLIGILFLVVITYCGSALFWIITLSLFQARTYKPLLVVAIIAVIYLVFYQIQLNREVNKILGRKNKRFF